MVASSQKIKDLEGFDAFDGKIPFSDLAADIAGVGYKTGTTTPSYIDGVRISEAKGAHKSQRLITAATRAVSSREGWMGGAAQSGLSTQVFLWELGIRGLGILASRVGRARPPLSNDPVKVLSHDLFL